MRAYVAVTDRDWCRFLRDRPDLDEVNFWQPGGSRQFTYLKPSEPFLFKLHYPENKIVGGGMFAHSSILLHGDDVLLREVLAKDFEFEGQREPLIAAQGIFKAADVPEMLLSDTTVPVVEGEGRSYDDGVEARVVSHPPGLTARGRGSSVRPSHAPGYVLGVE